MRSAATPEFPTTHWTLVKAVQTGDGPLAAVAMESLCQGYWYPIYAFLRRSGHSSEDAEDLTQTFFAQLVTEDALQRVRKEVGRLRSYLLGVLKRILSDHQRHASAIKRGGGQTPLSFEAMTAEQRYLHEPVDERDPEWLFTRAWAGEVVEAARQRLRESFRENDQGAVYEALLPFITWSDEPPSYRAIADQLGASLTSTRIQIFRLRARFRTMLEEEVARTVLEADDVAEEMALLHAALAEK